MKKKLLVIGIFLMMLGCKEELGEYYFDFNKIDYYSIKITEDELFDLEELASLTKNQQLQLDVIIGDIPESLNDTSFIAELENIGFVRKEISKHKYQDINEIFREKPHHEIWGTACIAVFRDIMIFRKKGEIVGIAKICFDCDKNQILGTDVNTFDFGQSGDYGKLLRILKK